LEKNTTNLKIAKNAKSSKEEWMQSTGTRASALNPEAGKLIMWKFRTKRMKGMFYLLD
jgi:hypothetical protein